MNTFRVPNNLIKDVRLSFSARKVGAVLFSRRNAKGSCRKSLHDLQVLTGLSQATIRKATEELVDANYITVEHNYKYNEVANRYVYDRNVYTCTLDFSQGYTLLPRTIFATTRHISSSCFTILMFLYHQAGQRKRAWPSISMICSTLGMANSTVCLALRSLKALSCLVVHSCIKVNNSFANNTYHITQPANTTQGVSMPCANLVDYLAKKIVNAVPLMPLSIANSTSVHNIPPLLENYLTTLRLT